MQRRRPRDAHQQAVDTSGRCTRRTRRLSVISRAPCRGQYFHFRQPREIFEELREASRGGHADYYGITCERLEREMGLFWPCPSEDHPGTPRLFEGGQIHFIPMERRAFIVTEYRESGDPLQ